MRERHARFKGTARLSITSLRFSENGVRAINQRNIDRLVNIYRVRGCLRREREHRIPALIESSALATALEVSGAVPDTLLGSEDDPPLLVFPEASVECLHGQHRILAASRYLEDNNRWWVVDLYDQGRSLVIALRQYFRDGYADYEQTSDGEIFRKLRLYSRSGQVELERNMWCQLSPSKQRDLKQLLANEPLRTAFDNLLDWPGLWPSMKLGTFHRLLTMRYVWRRICVDRPDIMASTDSKTVDLVQLRAPCASKVDRNHIELGMDSMLLYPAVINIQDRYSIREGICQMRQIPSLFTFFEDLIYLECCSKALRSLFDSSQGTIHESMSQLYTRHSATDCLLPIQLQDGTFRECAGNDIDGQEFGYQQLWLYVMRHFPEMVPATPRKENGIPKPKVKEPDSRTWYGFAALAQHLGFASEQIAALLITDP
ncbi:unnamed protein product, partial [Tuber aestivum]